MNNYIEAISPTSVIPQNYVASNLMKLITGAIFTLENAV